MNILILGGTGLISTAITRELLARGDRMTHFNRGQRDAEVPPGVTTVHGDRNDATAFIATMHALPTFDAVIDMIGYTPGNAESLVRAFAGRTDQIIFCSTVDVYQKPAARYPITEAEPLGLSEWDYARNKVLCERTLWDIHDLYGFKFTIIRPAHTYGEGSGLVHSFGGRNTYFDRLRKGKPIVVHGDGNSLWASCHRDDVARAFVAACGNGEAYMDEYHTAGEEAMTWNRYHEIVAEAIGAPPPTLVHIPTDLLATAAKRAFICKVNFQYNNVFDNTAARKDLGFQQTIPFAEGVKRVYSWLDAHGRIPDCNTDPYDDRVIEAWHAHGQHMADALSGLDT